MSWRLPVCHRHSQSVGQPAVNAGTLVIALFELPSHAFNLIRQMQRHQTRTKAFLKMILASGNEPG